MSGNKNQQGELVLSKEEIDAKGKAELGDMLHDFNLWRRGEGKYAWNEDPSKNEPCPFSPGTIGLFIYRVSWILKQN